ARAGVTPRHLPSGAGHDAMMFDGLTDVAMLFVRCGNGGGSHSPREIVTAEDADIAARLMLDAVVRLAGTSLCRRAASLRSSVAVFFARPDFLPRLWRCRAAIRPGIAL